MSAVERPEQSIADTTYRNSANNFALVSSFQTGCKYNISVRALTTVRGRPFVEELTLEISSKLLSSVIRDKGQLVIKALVRFP